MFGFNAIRGALLHGRFDAESADRWHREEARWIVDGTDCAQSDGCLRRILRGKRYLIHDRDTKCTQAFDGLFKASGVEPVVLPPRSPTLNAHCERFVRSIKEEALAQMVMLGERSLYYAIQQYLVHYHHERNHQGLGNQLITLEEGVSGHTSHVVRRERLGGLLSYSHREAA